MMQNKGRILVIEDEQDIRDLLKFNLSGRGYDVVACSSGEEGLLSIKDNVFDLLVLDWMLPGVSGVQVAKVARGMDNGKRLAVLMLTAKSNPSTIFSGSDLAVNIKTAKCLPFSMPRATLAT